jgi:hypothetical protein
MSTKSFVKNFWVLGVCLARCCAGSVHSYIGSVLTDNYLVEAGRTLRYRELTREDNRFKATLSIEVMICDIQSKSEYYEIYLSNTKHVVSMQITQMSNQCQCHILGVTELEQKVLFSKRSTALATLPTTDRLDPKDPSSYSLHDCSLYICCTFTLPLEV